LVFGYNISTLTGSSSGLYKKLESVLHFKFCVPNGIPCNVLKPTVSSIQGLQASALFSFRQNKHPQRDHHTSRRIPSSTRQITHIHVQTTSTSTRCKGQYNPSTINHSSYVLRIQTPNSARNIRQTGHKIYRVLSHSIFHPFITTSTNYVQHCKPHGTPFGTQKLKMQYNL
jgi:hypothetical protein